jgi:hypothetical protein
LVGEYRTCTSFAVWLSAHILNGERKFISSIQKRDKGNKTIHRILIYNHFDEVNHSFILLSK